MAINGTDILVLVNTGTDEAPVLTVVGSQRDVRFEESNETIDFSSKTQREWTGDYGRYSASLSLDALYVPDNIAYQSIKMAMRDGVQLLLRRSELGLGTEEADAIVTSMSEEFPDQGEGTISVDFTVNGAWREAGS